jgi:tripartite-type tricarboxylate transporter receptor subunit TctC
MIYPPRFLRLATATLLCLCSVMPTHAQAERFPNKILRLVVPFAPGGSVDNIARPLAQSMSEILGQQIIVDSRPGAAGNIGVDFVGQSAPDGYTMLLGNVSTNGINPSVYADRVKINITRDLRAVALVAAAPSVLVTSPKLPANSVAELVAYVKAHPKAVNHASAGAGSYAMIDMLRFERAAGLDMVHVPYKGAGQFVAALAADEVQLAFVNASTSIPLVKAGRLKALAVTTSKRMAQLPDVPTMAEAGFPNIGTNSWHAVFVPRATPNPIVDALFDAVQKTLAKPAFREHLELMTIEPMQSTSPAEADQFVQQQAVKWARTVKEFHISID